MEAVLSSKNERRWRWCCRCRPRTAQSPSQAHMSAQSDCTANTACRHRARPACCWCRCCTHPWCSCMPGRHRSADTARHLCGRGFKLHTAAHAALNLCWQTCPADTTDTAALCCLHSRARCTQCGQPRRLRMEMSGWYLDCVIEQLID